MRSLNLLLVFALTAGLSIATLFSFLGRSFWAFELLTHLRVHLAAIAFPLLILSLWQYRLSRRGGLSAAMAAFSFLLNFGFVLPDVCPQQETLPLSEDTAPNQKPLKFLMANVFTQNQDAGPLSRLIHEEEPDIIGLVEVNARWLKELRYLRGRYPYVLEDPRPDNFGIALYSRFPLIEAEAIPLGTTSIKALSAGVEWDDRRIDLLLAHPVPPVSARYAELRNQQFKVMASEHAASSADAYVVFGDLNTTPWSPRFRDLLRETNLQLAARDHNLSQTWPTGLPISLGIPIDHALLSKGLRATRFSAARPIGSDHLPILFDLQFR